MGNHDSGDDVADQDTTGRTVVGMFTNRPDAEAAIRELKTAGFGGDRIGVALQDSQEQRGLRDRMETSGREAAGGAAKGAVSGSLVGGAGIGAATGGIIGALVALGVPEADAKHFDEGLRSGRTLVTVDAGARTTEALMLLDRHGMDFGPSGASRYQSGTGAGGELARERGRYRGMERRTTRDPTFAGPERRLVGV